MIAIISGSSRSNNNTLKVAKALSKIIQEQHQLPVQLLNFQSYDLPFFNQGQVQAAHLSEWQTSLVDVCSNAKLIIVLTPEYNWFPSAELFQMVNVFGSGQFIDMWKGKVFAMCGVSSGRGGRLPAVYLMELYNKMIHVLNANSIVSPKLLEAQFVTQFLSEEGELQPQSELAKAIHDFVVYNVHLMQSFKA